MRSVGFWKLVKKEELFIVHLTIGVPGRATISGTPYTRALISRCTTGTRPVSSSQTVSSGTYAVEVGSSSVAPSYMMIPWIPFWLLLDEHPVAGTHRIQ